MRARSKDFTAPRNSKNTLFFSMLINSTKRSCLIWNSFFFLFFSNVIQDIVDFFNSSIILVFVLDFFNALIHLLRFQAALCVTIWAFKTLRPFPVRQQWHDTDSSTWCYYQTTTDMIASLLFCFVLIELAVSQ